MWPFNLYPNSQACVSGNVVIDRVGADITVLREREVDYDSDEPRKIAEVLIRKVPDNQQVSEPTVKAFVADLFI